jgi:hypothetical protein
MPATPKKQTSENQKSSDAASAQALARAVKSMTVDFENLFRENVPCAHRPHLPRATCLSRPTTGNLRLKPFYIDAVNDQNDTRETLLRYTFKSYPVNILIGGNL